MVLKLCWWVLLVWRTVPTLGAAKRKGMKPVAPKEPLVPRRGVRSSVMLRTVGADAEVLIMTTASVPWFTGTAINPLLRAAHLAVTGRKVTLYLPWVSDEGEQKKLYHATFRSKLEQSQHVFDWLSKEANMEAALSNLKIAFYEARFHEPHGSLYPLGETLETFGDLERFTAGEDKGVKAAYVPEVVVLEEPEHLNWYAYKGGDESAWRKFSNVVGVVHTNYPMYARTEKVLPRWLLGDIFDPLLLGPIKGFFTLAIAKWMCAAHCHEIVKLSKALPKNLGGDDRDVVANVHGVRSVFLRIGDAKATTSPFYVQEEDSSDEKEDSSDETTTKATSESLTSGAYFVGKMLWPKGLDKLAKLLSQTQKQRYDGSLPSTFHLIGDGPDLPAIERHFQKLQIDCKFQGRMDHAKGAEKYRVLVNPSESEVLCTTVAEAIAMGKWVIVKRHPSNDFFMQFPTCLAFSTFDDFAKAYSKALNHEPPPLTRSQRHTLTWEAATERFCRAATSDKPVQRFPNQLAAWAHCHLGRGLFGDLLRTIAGGGPRLGFQARYVTQQRAAQEEADEAGGETEESPSSSSSPPPTKKTTSSADIDSKEDEEVPSSTTTE